MQTRGDIFFHPNFKFRNGSVGRKLLLLLNTPGKKETCIFVKTTSQQKNNPSRPGCIKERSLFFIPSGKTFFKEDTWIELYERYEMHPEDVDKNTDVQIIGSLDSKLVDKIIDCLFVSEDYDIPPIHRKLLRPQLQESILKLKKKFNSL